MKGIQIILCAVVLILSFVSCEKEIHEMNETSNLNVIPTTRSSSASLLDGMLHFSSKADVEDYDRFLQQLREDNEILTDNEGNYFDVVKHYREQIGFSSLRDVYDEYALENIDWMDGDRSYIGFPLLQNILSAKKEVAIGTQIFKHVELSKIAVIEDLDLEALEDVRANGVHSEHSKVSYIDRFTDDIVKHVSPNGSGWTGTNNTLCSGYLTVVHETFFGADANKVSISAKMKKLWHGCKNAIKYSVDWGDGTITSYLNDTHTYQVPQFSIGECATFTITVTAEWKYACGGCPKGRKSTKTFDVELCPLPDLCIKGEKTNRTSEIFYTAINSPKYKLVGEIGIEKCGYILDYYHAAYAVTSLYKTTGNPVQNHYVEATPSKHVGVDLYGVVFSDDACSVSFSADSDPKEQKEHSVERRTYWNINPIYTHKTGPDQIYADFWVETGGDLIEIEQFGLWD